MAKHRAGYERQVFIGTAGSTAATQLLHVVDADVEKGNERADETDRGDGSAIPKKHEMVVQRTRQVKWTYRYYDSDANMTTLLAALHAGTPIAVLINRYASGTVEFDGDVTLDYSSPGPLTDGQVLEFTGMPTRAAGREWSDS